MERRIRLVLLLLGLAFVLHELEEWNIVSWYGANFAPAPAFDDAEARTLLVLFALLGLSFTLLCLWLLELRAALFALLPLFLAVVFGNALAHVVWLVSFRTYAPGVITSALLLVPLCLVLAREVLRARLVPAAFVWTLLGLALLQPIAAAVGGGSLSEAQLALQRSGGQLARSLWIGGG